MESWVVYMLTSLKLIIKSVGHGPPCYTCKHAPNKLRTGEAWVAHTHDLQAWMQLRSRGLLDLLHFESYFYFCVQTSGLSDPEYLVSEWPWVLGLRVTPEYSVSKWPHLSCLALEYSWGVETVLRESGAQSSRSCLGGLVSGSVLGVTPEECCECAVSGLGDAVLERGLRRTREIWMPSEFVSCPVLFYSFLSCSGLIFSLSSLTFLPL